MRLIKIAAAALNQTPLDWEGNKKNILTTLKKAQDEGIGIICLPELCVPGYGCEDAFQSTGTIQTSFDILNEILPATQGLVVSIGIPLLHNRALFNTAAVIADGKILGFVAKKNLAGDGIYYEPRWFKPWPAGIRAEYNNGDQTYPIGDIHFEIGDIKIGFEICEDAWVADRPGRELAQKGVDIILNPSASHFAFGKHVVRTRIVEESSRALSVAYVYANHVGCDAGRIIYDGDCLIAVGGKLIAQGKRFSFEEVTITSAVIDLDELRINQAKLASFKPQVEQDPHAVKSTYKVAQTKTAPHRIDTQSFEQSPYLKNEEFCRAVTLGLFDYLRKSRSHGFVVSLSGGADSSAVSCLVYLMVKLGTQELGVARFLQRLSYVAALQNAKNVEQIVAWLLTCVYQRTRNNSATTRQAATELAKALGARFIEFEVDAFVDQYVAMVSKAIGRDLTWEKDDATLQNVQARARVPGVWLLANERRALLLTTSNRSEAAVGYATMDGDTSGGLNPIGGIDKAFLREWLAWLEKHGPLGGGAALPILSLVTAQAPTAELRPAGSNQTDESDLMPYVVLDKIERLAIRDKKMPLEVLLSLREEFNGKYTLKVLGGWIDRFFHLWSINQWKRERLAPSFHLDDENLDPKTWCRFPILSGGFKREREALKKFLAEERE